MGVLKNQQLLWLITGLGALTFLAALNVLMSEKSNASAIARLEGGHADLQHKLTEQQVDFALKVAEVRSELAALKSDLASLRGELHQFVTQFVRAQGTVEKEIKSLTAKKWLSESGQEKPWASDVDGLNKKVVGLELELKKCVKKE